MKNLKKRAVQAVAALALSLAGFAALPATAQELSPEHLAVARQYVELTDNAGIYETALIETAVETMRTIVGQNPELVDETDAAITTTLDFYKGKKGDLLDQFARVYALNLSMEELEEIVAFYESPVGRKLSAANATLNESLQTVMGVFQTNLRTEFFAKVRAELREAGFDV
ncbi:MAG TPA: DUF2059 domain-containing protein [Devosiaceae bacterium]|jgi:hypothetical protein|nr:DUF2059 domain-containing protein [Devosiaceae bacterium]